MKREYELWALTKNGKYVTDPLSLGPVLFTTRKVSRDYATKSEEAVRVKVTIEPVEGKR